jgi:hypothetical protein
MARKMGRALAAIAAPLLAAGGAGPALAATAAPAGPQDGDFIVPPPGVVIYTWQNQLSKKYMHVESGSLANGAGINVNANSGTPCQYHGATPALCDEEWVRISTGYANEFAYQNEQSGLCLSDDNDLAEGAAPIQYTCGNYPVQRRWHHITSGQVHGLTDSAIDAGGTRTTGWICEASGDNLEIIPGNVAPASHNSGYYCSWQ